MKCLLCDDEKVGHKYCASCKKIAKKITNREFAIRKKLANLKPCAVCQEKYTRYKYCDVCGPLVASGKEPKVKKCMRCKTNDRVSNGHAAKYCQTCKTIVTNETAEKHRLGADEKIPIDPYFLTRGKISYAGYR